MLFKKSHNVLAGVSVTGAVHKFCVAHNILEKFFRRAGIGEIAPSLSGDKQLFPKLLILFIQMHFVPVSRRLHSGEHSRRAAADNSYLSHNFLPVMIILCLLCL